MTTAATAESIVWQATVDDIPVTLTAGGRLAAVAGAEGTCAVFDAKTGERVASLSVDGGLLDAAFSPDGAHLALTSTAVVAQDLAPDAPAAAAGMVLGVAVAAAGLFYVALGWLQELIGPTAGMSIGFALVAPAAALALAVLARRPDAAR